jgi:hypothetical protein
MAITSKIRAVPCNAHERKQGTPRQIPPSPAPRSDSQASDRSLFGHRPHAPPRTRERHQTSEDWTFSSFSLSRRGTKGASERVTPEYISSKPPESREHQLSHHTFLLIFVLVQVHTSRHPRRTQKYKCRHHQNKHLHHREEPLAHKASKTPRPLLSLSAPQAKPTRPLQAFLHRSPTRLSSPKTHRKKLKRPPGNRVASSLGRTVPTEAKPSELSGEIVWLGRTSVKAKSGEV